MKKTEDSGEKFRQTLPESRRIVVKIGSKVIVDAKGRPDRRRLAAIVAQVAALRRRGVTESQIEAMAGKNLMAYYDRIDPRN